MAKVNVFMIEKVFYILSQPKKRNLESIITVTLQKKC
jgi:hypothetical protein